MNGNRLRYSDAFLDTTSKTRSMREIIDKLDFIKIKTFCCVKGNVKRIRQQAKDGDNICIQIDLIMDCYPKYAKNS